MRPTIRRCRWNGLPSAAGHWTTSFAGSNDLSELRG
jgi:hypothetical protein